MFIDMNTIIYLRRVNDTDKCPDKTDNINHYLFNEGFVMTKGEDQMIMNLDKAIAISRVNNKAEIIDLYEKAKKVKIEYNIIRELLYITLPNNELITITVILDEKIDFKTNDIIECMESCDWFDNIQNYLYRVISHLMVAKKVI